MIKSYPENYKVTDINRMNCRYSLEISAVDSDKEQDLIVLMENPSVGDEYEMDSTIQRLVDHVAKNYKKMIIVNVTPVVATSDLDKYIHEINEQKSKNVKVVKSIIDNASDEAELLVATGDLSNVKGSDELCKALQSSYVELMDMIGNTSLYDNMHVISLVGNENKKYGGHPLRKDTDCLDNLTDVTKVEHDAAWHLKEIKA
ncbi:DUF1643 domain-containing protein [Levilactobacillus lanxiensis]|uniref:DUF1643 domain-containing protein n=1 Tax=Levilactobacillus lanxiensis TaxID=2799568 RepID=A0ABW4D2B7_9LACO|nr:DUF1643 domain-containing protein [Levilactobacillus lanxiensis]